MNQKRVMGKVHSQVRREATDWFVGSVFPCSSPFSFSSPFAPWSRSMPTRKPTRNRLTASGALRGFAPTYHSNPGLEAYIALPSSGHRGCSFAADTVYAISLGAPRGVVAVSPQGRVRRFATIRAPGLIDGIAFDETGHFGYRLLVTTTAGPRTAVDAIGCHGAVTRITSTAHRVEGGIAVAPASFGRFAGDLIMSDELGGGIYAVTPAVCSIKPPRSRTAIPPRCNAP